MNKKLLMSILPLVLGLILVNAVLVTYLSNTITADVEVKSPMVLTISEDEIDWADSLTLPVMYTGGNNVVTFYTREENIADESVTGDIENIVTSSGIKCADFESVIVSTKLEGGEYGAELDLIAENLCEQDGYNRVKFNYPNPQNWDAEQVDINKIVVTFNNVIGKYTFKSQIVPTIISVN